MKTPKYNKTYFSRYYLAINRQDYQAMQMFFTDDVKKLSDIFIHVPIARGAEKQLIEEGLPVITI